jgi:tRNA threonylcarbamoyladenosine biosynthesis protein TsaE
MRRRLPVRKDGAVTTTDLAIVPCRPDDADELHRVTQAAFATYAVLTPPTGAIYETVDELRVEIERTGAVLARQSGQPVGGLRFAPKDHLWVRRVAVLPELQRRGIGGALMTWAVNHARGLGLPEVRLGVRDALPGNRSYYEHLGYVLMRTHEHHVDPSALWHELRLAVS